MSIKKLFKNKKGLFRVGVFLGAALLTITTIVLSGIFLFNNYHKDRVFPGIYILGMDVSGKTKDEVKRTLAGSVGNLPEKIILIGQNETFEILLNEIEFGYDLEQTATSAFSVYRSSDSIRDLTSRLQSVTSRKDIGLNIKLNQEKLNEFLSVVSAQTSKEPIYPSAFLKDGEVVVERGTAGTSVDRDKLKREIVFKLSRKDYSETTIPTFSVNPTISEIDAENFKIRATKLIGKKLVLVYKKTTLTFDEERLLELIAPEVGFNDKSLKTLISEVSEKVNSSPQNAVFKLDGGRAVEFLPAKDGLAVRENKLQEIISENLKVLEETDKESVTLTIPVYVTPAVVTTKEVNDLGINELIGIGVSKFAGSIASRIHNIGLASSKFNGILVAPSEVVSFNKILGDVSGFTGYKQAYIIKDGKTVLGDGGGVCQVSTTLFRAVLNAGLPIIERRAHSYRVGYYEQNASPGLDATVFDPTTDFKFKNDTPGHILIQTIFDSLGKTLTFELYGTNDGRVVTQTKPTLSAIVPPPEDVYTDDPTIPTGTTKQVEYKAWGARASFNYKVEKEGIVTFEKTFISNYRPWGAVYLRGTGLAQ